jgi:hypothetical protein
VDNFSFKFAGNRSYQTSDKYRPSVSKNHEECRKPLDPKVLSITPDLIQWLRILPARVRPKNLILKFPRVANTLARYAPYPKVLDRLLSEYMLDERGDRKGFPFDVLQEMANLREYYSSGHRGA